MTYEQKKQQLIQDLLVAKKTGTVALGKSTSNLFRHRDQKNAAKINVRDFNTVIEIDPELLVAHVEGMTTYATLVAEALKYNLMPTVVPELKSITVGGAVTGVGIEASSFKYGLVHETILAMEILLGDGTVVKCDKDTNADLFYGFPNSYGTFGYALKLTVKLIPVKPYVKLEHVFFDNAESYFAALHKFCARQDVDFVDGTIFDSTKMYITLGTFSAEALTVSDYTHMNIYYQSIATNQVDYLTTHDYIWRWDTDWFWCSKHFGVENKLVRFLWGKKRLNSLVYNKLRRLNGKLPFHFGSGESLIQDVEIPIQNSAAFLDFFQKEIGIAPVWVCPVQTYNKSVEYSLYPMNADTLYVNFGFWDVIKSDKEEYYYNKLIEKKVKELAGKKSLYSSVHYSEAEFWELYNQPTYDKLKAKYDPTGAFKNLFQKCASK